jgi:hypothetical protein
MVMLGRILEPWEAGLGIAFSLAFIGMALLWRRLLSRSLGRELLEFVTPFRRRPIEERHLARLRKGTTVGIVVGMVGVVASLVHLVLGLLKK